MIQRGSKKKESDFQTKAQELIRQEGGYVVKVHVSAFESQGVPDIICCIAGCFVAFELKVKGNDTSDLQDAVIKEIKSAGGISKKVDTLQEIKETIHEIFRVQSRGKSER